MFLELIYFVFIIQYFIFVKGKYDLIFSNRENLQYTPKKRAKKVWLLRSNANFFIKDENTLFIAWQKEKTFS